MDIVAFIEARLEEDAAAAAAASPGKWSTECHQWNYLWHVRDQGGHELMKDKWTDSGFQHADALHIARHDPERVLRQADSLARLARSFASVLRAFYPEEDAGHLAVAIFLEPLAAVWADHPDYNPDWRGPQP